MLKVKFSKQGRMLNLELDGHAGQATIGHDIVCSACSILAYTTAQIVKSAYEQGDLTEEPIIKLDSGDAIISCEPTDDVYTIILTAYTFAQIGYLMLAHEYPQFVDVKPFGTE